MILPALSLRQPWAWLVVHGGKDIENRKWDTKLRGTFLIHAAKGMTNQEWVDAKTFARAAGFTGILPRTREGGLARGGIIGAARIERVHSPGRQLAPWHMQDQFGFVLADIAPLPFREYSGALGFFRVEVTPDEQQWLRAAGLLDIANQETTGASAPESRGPHGRK